VDSRKDMPLHGKQTGEPYRPIDCSLHDELEAAATLRKTVRISYRASQGGLVEIEDRILDIFTRDGAEYVQLSRGAEVRLDDLRSVDGLSFDDRADGLQA
jgi:transcriptional antiterminator Rof (Rho-off)